MNNRVNFGFKNVHIAFLDKDAQDQPAWETPVAIKGAVSFSAKPEGEASDFYADDGVYFRMAANNGYAGELGIAYLPDEIKAKMYGWSIDTNGMVTEVADAIPAKFAIMGEVSGDVKSRKFVFYDVVADRSEDSAKTKEKGVEPTTTTIPVKISPVVIGDKQIVKGTMELNESNNVAFEGFFSSVYVPDFTA